MAGGLELGDLQGPFQLKPFYDSIFKNYLFNISVGCRLKHPVNCGSLLEAVLTVLSYCNTNRKRGVSHKASSLMCRS